MVNPADSGQQPPPAEQPTAQEAVATTEDAAGAVAWAPGQPAPSGFVVIPADDADPEHLQRSSLPDGQQPAARAVATEALVCVISGEEIAAGEEYVDGGDVWDGITVDADGKRVTHRYIVKVGHESEAHRLA